MRCKGGQEVDVDEKDWPAFALIPTENVRGAMPMKSMNLCAPGNIPESWTNPPAPRAEVTAHTYWRGLPDAPLPLAYKREWRWRAATPVESGSADRRPDRPAQNQTRPIHGSGQVS